MSDPRSPPKWHTLLPGLLVATALHGALVAALVLKFGYQAHVVEAPPSLSIEMVAMPPSPAPQPRPQPQPSAPRPLQPAPPSPLDKLKLPPALPHDDVTLPPPKAQPQLPPQPPRQAPAAPEVPVQAAAAKKADQDRVASAVSTDPNAKPTWESMVVAKLEAAKRYPASARFAHEEGTIVVRFTVKRDGKVRDAKIVGRSTLDDLEEETLDLVHRVRLPPPPSSLSDQDLVLTVPIEFSIQSGR